MFRKLTIILFIFAFFQLKGQTVQRGVARLTVADTDTGKVYGIVIGISNYEQLLVLQYADKDAMAFYQFLQRSKLPADKKDISLYLNKEANFRDIVDKFYQINETCKQGDRVYIYFGGHGDLEQLIQTDNCLLLLANSDKKNYLRNPNGYLDMNLFRSFFKSWSDKKVKTIFVCDACHSGSLSGGESGMKNTLLSLQQSWANEIKLLSCQSNELSLEGPQWGGGRGLFSYYLVLGLEGEADKDKDRNVTLLELDNYLKDNVVNQSANTQIPSLNGDLRYTVNKVSDEMITDLKKNLNKQNDIENNKYALANRSNNDAVINSLKDVGLQNLYADFNKQLTNNQLFEPEQYCAFNSYTIFPDNAESHLAKGAMKLMLIDNLTKQFDNLLPLIYNDEAEQLPPLELYNVEKSLVECMKLINPNHYLYNKIKAKKLYIDACKEKSGLNPFSQQGAAFNDKIYKGISFLKQAILLDSIQPYLYLQLGNFYLAVSNYDESIKWYKKYQNLLPKDEYAFNKIGLAYVAIKQYNKAIESFRNAIIINPSFYKAKINLESVIRRNE